MKNAARKPPHCRCPLKRYSGLILREGFKGDFLVQTTNSRLGYLLPAGKMYSVGIWGLYHYTLGYDNIPEGSVVTFDYTFTYEGELSSEPHAVGYVPYFAGRWGEAVAEDQFPLGSFDASSGTHNFTYSFEVKKHEGAVGFQSYIYLFDIVPVNDKVVLEVVLNSFTLTMTLSAFEDMLEEQGKTNDLLEDILNRPANPKPPAGTDNVTNSGEKEDQLFQDSAAGRNEFADTVLNSAAFLELYIPSFAFLSACLNPIFDIPWIREILTISLGLGTTGFLLNLGFSAISKIGKSDGKSNKSSGKGGGK